MSPPSIKPKSGARVARWASAHPLLAVALLLGAGLSAAAVTVVYTNSSSLTTSVAPAPIQFVAGDDAGLGTYLTAYSISTNRTHMTAAVKGVPESTLTVGSFFKLQNVDTASRAVTLTTSNVTNSLVSAYSIQLYDGSGNLVDTLDLRAATGTVSATAVIPAGQTYTARLVLTLASGAGAHNVALTNSLALTFT